MPDKVGRFTVQEERFVEHYARTNDPTYAAAKAGYAHPQPRGSQNLQKPGLMALVQQARERLCTEGAAVGVGVLLELALDAKRVPPGVRRAAASDLVKYSGVAADASGDNVEPHEMTADQLAAARRAQELRLAAIDAAAATRAVDITPGSAEPPTGPGDVFE